jgi:hypothetical protein
MEAEAKQKAEQKANADAEILRKLTAALEEKESIETTAQRKPPEVVLNNGDKTDEGRPKMKGGEKWDVTTGKESAMEEKEEEKEKTEEEKDVEHELNSILKRSPSTYRIVALHYINSWGF